MEYKGHPGKCGGGCSHQNPVLQKPLLGFQGATSEKCGGCFLPSDGGGWGGERLDSSLSSLQVVFFWVWPRTNTRIWKIILDNILLGLLFFKFVSQAKKRPKTQSQKKYLQDLERSWLMWGSTVNLRKISVVGWVCDLGYFSKVDLDAYHEMMSYGSIKHSVIHQGEIEKLSH